MLCPEDAMEIIDISVPIRPGMIVYDGDPDVHMERVKTIAGGSSANVSRVDFGVHTGTHIDAPVHFIDGAPAMESVPLDALIGPAHVVDATGLASHIDATALSQLAIPPAERIIFKTNNSRLWDLDRFSADFIALTGDAAAALVQRGVKLVGIDYLSIGPKGNGVATHVALLEAGVVILEGLDLRHVEPGPYRLACLPLLLVGSDGAPARAVLMRE
ncbi:MAG: cyclase family protein [Chloroflexi bacterium]|nr:cyclase family protein [Chloroflexota bacterium]